MLQLLLSMRNHTLISSCAALQNVLLQSQPMPEGTPEISGHDFDEGRELDAIMAKMATSGFQASKLGDAVELVNEMVRRRCVAWAPAGAVGMIAN